MNYKEDFNFYLNYLKRNNPKLKDLNVNELIEKNDNICNCDNDYEFFKKLLSFYINNFTLSQGHNQPLYPFIPKDFIAPNSYVNKYLSQMKHSNFSQIKPLTKTYLLSIIDDNIIIKIPKMKLPNDNEIKELKEFLRNNKERKEMYIDIRGNSGGNSNCWKILFSLIFNKTFHYYYNDIKCHFNYTNDNKDFIDYRLKGYEFHNSNITSHYVIQHLKNKTFTDKDTINYQGKVYIVYDDKAFSSSQSLLDISKGNINLLSNSKSSGIGTYGRPSGTEQGSSYFLLPNTKILCCCEIFTTEKDYSTIPDDIVPEWLEFI